MKETQGVKLKATGFALSSPSGSRLYFTYMGPMLVILVLMLPLMHVFPILREHDWIFAIPAILTGGILVLHLLCYFTRLWKGSGLCIPMCNSMTSR